MRPSGPAQRSQPKRVEPTSTVTRARIAFREHSFAILIVLLLEQIHGRHGDYARIHAVSLQLFPSPPRTAEPQSLVPIRR